MNAPISTKPIEPKKKQILETGLVLFAEIGFEATPVPLIAEKAGVATGTIYRYFPSKESLLNEIYRNAKLAVEEIVFRNFSEQKTIEAKFRNICKNWIEISKENPILFQFLELHLHDAYLDEESKKIEFGFKKKIQQFIKEGQNSGILEEYDPMFLYAIVTGAITKIFKSKIPWTKKTIEHTIDLCWKLISK